MSRTSGQVPLPISPLPLADHSPHERADAARNRQKILQVAAAILDAEGPEGLSVDKVARLANTGVGTVYRRFGDRAGLILALLDEKERRFQESFMNGEPPLGPGAPARERLQTFVHSLVDRMDTQGELLMLAEKTSFTGRLRSGPYALYHLHLSVLLSELGPAGDPRFLADVLLATISAQQVHWLQEGRGMSIGEIKTGLDDLLNALCGPIG